MIVRCSSGGFITVWDVANTLGQFHDTVQEQQRYFKSHTAAHWTGPRQVMTQNRADDAACCHVKSLHNFCYFSLSSQRAKNEQIC